MIAIKNQESRIPPSAAQYCIRRVTSHCTSQSPSEPQASRHISHPISHLIASHISPSPIHRPSAQSSDVSHRQPTNSPSAHSSQLSSLLYPNTANTRRAPTHAPVSQDRQPTHHLTCSVASPIGGIEICFFASGQGFITRRREGGKKEGRL
ncbi:hypothetical protein BDW22DRAFT_1266509 [Trametopsis cervina]|nr:hypothetical protein BDW22DRAFT_1266509 [Trametopsis cervina]